MRTQLPTVRTTLAAVAILLTAHTAPALEIRPASEELHAEKAWLKEHLLDCKLKPAPAGPVAAEPLPPEPGLDVLANHDPPVIQNGRGDKRMRIGDKEYTRGLYCHAVSKVEVRLPGPGKSFSAVAGLDHNDDTAHGKGSVIFSVKVKDKVAFQSDVMRYGTPGREVNVNLAGADTFTLEIGDAGDGIGWDQSDWADAKVTLADGKELWLGDMPLRDRRTEQGPPPIQRTSALPFSFVYGGHSSDELLAVWPKKTARKKLDSTRTQHTLTWTDPRTGLEARCVAVEYADFPVAEWTIFIKNTGHSDTPILENLQALDAKFERGKEGEFTLHGNKGDWCAPQSYEPYLLALGPGSRNSFAPDGGRPTNGPRGWPYFNLQMPGGGLIFAIGWPGQWACSFIRDDQHGLKHPDSWKLGESAGNPSPALKGTLSPSKGERERERGPTSIPRPAPIQVGDSGVPSLRVVAGQQVTHFFLKPGEEIRTPLIAALFWKGADITKSHHKVGQAFEPAGAGDFPVAGRPGRGWKAPPTGRLESLPYIQGRPNENCCADIVRAQNLWRRWFLAHNIPRINGRPPPTMLQMQCYRTFEKGGEKDLYDTVEEFNQNGIPFDLCWRDAGWYPCKGSWPNTGTWEIDATRYPHGFRPFSDWLHAQGKKFIVWFEPERVGDKESWLAKNHPDWIIGGNLLNLGNPEAWSWLVDHIDGMLREQGIDYYRQDFNMDPLRNWRAADPPDRKGMTEMKHVMGYLAFWDELHRRHPGLLIDSCASGGRRNDLETLRRAVPLLRSDFQFGHEATMPNQGHTYGISSWIPYYGSGCAFTDPYSARSYIMPCSGYGGTNAATKLAYEECRSVAPFMLGDYYPLTPYSIQLTDWIAWQFDRPDLGSGVVQAFRRDRNESPSRTLRLFGLSPSGNYEITDHDGGAPRTMSGKDLMERGLPVEIKTQPGSTVIMYRKY